MNKELPNINKTPVVPLSKVGDANIYLKLEGTNPTGSHKDRTASKIVQDFYEQGLLKAGKTLIDASSGSFGCALAHIGMQMNIPVTIVSNQKLTAENANFIKLTGAELIMHGKSTGESNLYVQELIQKNPDKFVFCDQLNNWSSPQAHYQTTGPEILNDLPNVRAVFSSLGTGATLWGIGKYLKEKNPDIFIGASIAAPGTTIAGTHKEGIDYVTPFNADIRENRYVDDYSQITTEQAYSRAHTILEQGQFAGPQTGGVYQAALDLISKHNIKGDVVLISGDTGWKNLSKLAETKS